jgi:hypothetical protein
MASKPSRLPSVGSPFVLLTVLLIGLAAGAGGTYMYSHRGLPTGQDEVTTLQAILAQYMELPSEPPTLATVSDVSKLRNETFFTRAQNGDKVLIYPTTKKAYLYRPSTKKIIEVGPVNINNTPQSGTSSNAPVSSASAQVTPKGPTPTPKPIRVALYNGTTRTGLTRTAETQLKKDRPNITVADKTNAAKNTYKETIIVDVSGSMAVIANQLAATVKGKVAALPEGEQKPDADILIILGSTYQQLPSVTP